MLKLKVPVGLVLILLSYSSKLVSQIPTDPAKAKLSIDLNAFYGFFIANQPKSLYLRNDHSRMMELSISRQTTGRHKWERESNLPRIGIGLLHGDLGSRQYLGKMTALYPFIHFPLIRAKRSVTSFRLGAGLGWVEKPYDKETNYKNLMIGTHLNAAISMRLQTEWEITSNLYLNTGIAFTHLSNGSVRLPNLGLNIPAITAGLRYQVPSSNAGKATVPPEVVTQYHHGTFTRRTNLFVHAGFALKQTYPLESKVQLVRILNLELTRTLSAVSRVAGGLNFSYDPSLSKEISEAPTYTFDKSEVQLQGSIYAGYEHVVGKLSIPVQLGVYLYNNYQISQVYQMIGLRYLFSQRWVASVQLKAHFGKADYIQYGVGYKIF
ncbi:acyloxyacyl hydrolase [Flavitalea sp.]|nr:acyloxyacyl hydrolase [Flavitalea sp.]